MGWLWNTDPDVHTSEAGEDFWTISHSLKSTTFTVIDSSIDAKTRGFLICITVSCASVLFFTVFTGPPRTGFFEIHTWRGALVVWISTAPALLGYTPFKAIAFGLARKLVSGALRVFGGDAPPVHGLFRDPQNSRFTNNNDSSSVPAIASSINISNN